MWMLAATAVTNAISTAMQAKAASDQGIYGQNAANAQATAARRGAMEAEQQAEDVTVQVQQEEQMRMDKLSGILAAGEVNAAVSGLSSDSGTLEALARHNREVVGGDLMGISYNAMAKRSSLLRQAQYLREGAETYIKQGYEARSAADLAMWGTIFKGASSMASNAYFGGVGGATMGSSTPPPGSMSYGGPR